MTDLNQYSWTNATYPFPAKPDTGTTVRRLEKELFSANKRIRLIENMMIKELLIKYFGDMSHRILDYYGSGV